MKTFHRLLLVYSCLLFGALSITTAQNSTTASSGQRCVTGLEFQMSYSHNWGANKPVILAVIPQGPADLAGLKVGDIIETINGKPTADMEEKTIIAHLSKTSPQGVTLTVSNFGYRGEPRTLYTKCLSRQELNEADLASAFSLYSIEDECERLIAYPFNTGTEPKFDFQMVKYFHFVPGSTSSPSDQEIAKVITATLQSKGLVLDQKEADILVDTYYTLQENPYYDAKVADETLLFANRWNPATGLVNPYPMLTQQADKRAAKYILTFGLRLHDARHTGSLLWSCEATEQLTDTFSIEEYAQLAIPAMLMQFPFVRYNRSTVLRVAHHQHHYTGINYKATDVSLVSSVDPNSPAAQAGILQGDRIVTINGKMVADSKTLSKKYLDFVKSTLQYRDGNSAFTDRRGLKNCRYWKTEDYKQVAKTLAKEKYLSPFAYLFSFRPWVYEGAEAPTGITFGVLRDGVLQNIEVTPTQRRSSYIALE